jgi:hypothetical protein
MYCGVTCYSIIHEIQLEMLLFNEAFELYIKDQKAVSWGFQQQKRVSMGNGSYAFPCGYYILYANDYKIIISGESLGQTPVQEAMILNPEGIPIARDTEDIKGIEF